MSPCVRSKAEQLAEEFGVPAWSRRTDITQLEDLTECLEEVLERFGRLDILINNAANNPKMESPGTVNFSRFEHFPLEQWAADLGVGLTGAFLSSQVLGTEMARQGRGVILNIASDLALIAPDQRIYRKAGVPEHLQPVKPVTYSIVKSALIGLTRYLATYWGGLRRARERHFPRRRLQWPTGRFRDPALPTDSARTHGECGRISRRNPIPSVRTRRPI